MATPTSVKSFPYCDRRGPSAREESVQGSTAAGNDDLMGCLITGENKVLFEEVSPVPLLSHKLRLLIKMLRCAPTVEKVANSATMALSLFYMFRNFTQIFRTQQRHLLCKAIEVPCSYATSQRDGITLAQRATFLMQTKYFSISLTLQNKRDCFSGFVIE
jgi:hypothetical protein